MYYLKVSEKFDAAHFLKGYDGKCKNIHGHSWKIEIEFCSHELKKTGSNRGMQEDFSVYKEILRQETNMFDHKLIFEKDTLKQSTLQALEREGFDIVEVDFRPTAENLAKYFYNKIRNISPNTLYLVTVYETENNCASYREEN